MEKLLVVDDERSMRELLELVLKREGTRPYSRERQARARASFARTYTT